MNPFTRLRIMIVTELILPKLTLARQVFVTNYHTEFHKNPTHDSVADTRGHRRMTAMVSTQGVLLFTSYRRPDNGKWVNE